MVVFDARGSGQSEGNAPFTHEQWVADVEGLREWVGAERIVIAGGSYGGLHRDGVRHPAPRAGLALVLRDTSADHANEEMARANALASRRVDLDMGQLERIMDGAVRERRRPARVLGARSSRSTTTTTTRPRCAERVATTPYRYETHNLAFAAQPAQYDIKASAAGGHLPDTGDRGPGRLDHPGRVQ